MIKHLLVTVLKRQHKVTENLRDALIKVVVLLGVKYQKRIKNVLTDFPEQKIIIFSRWNRMLLLIGRILENLNLKYVFCRGNVQLLYHIQ